jgi:sec-independent protein translocase protein TatC
VSQDESELEASRAPLLDHLTELRTRLIWAVVAFAAAFALCFGFGRQIYLFLLHPYVVAGALMAAQKAGGGHIGPFDLVLALTGFKAVAVTGAPMRLISTGPLEIFFTQMKLAGFGAIALSFPVLAGQIYAFVAPGLYRKERKAFLPFLLATPVLFLMGAALVYYLMFPFVLWFSLSQQIVDPNIQVDLLPKISDYMTLMTQMLLAFGLCFQLPVVLSLAGLAGLISSKTLATGRRYAVVAIVFLAAIVTPPDPISQIMLSIPLYLLYEVSIWCVRLMELRRKKAEAAEALVP